MTLFHGEFVKPEKTKKADVVPAEVPTEVEGCCFSLGYGNYMRECCHKRIGDYSQSNSDMISESDCDVKMMAGGGVQFEPDMTCKERFAKASFETYEEYESEEFEGEGEEPERGEFEREEMEGEEAED
eukprot:UN22461